MRTNGRQTNLDLEELIARIEDNAPGYPTCLLLNEVGEICLKAKENQKGEEFLVENLGHQEKMRQAVAFCWLTVINEKTQRHTELLANYRSNPANAEIVQKVEEGLAQFR